MDQALASVPSARFSHAGRAGVSVRTQGCGTAPRATPSLQVTLRAVDQVPKSPTAGAPSEAREQPRHATVEGADASVTRVAAPAPVSPHRGSVRRRAAREARQPARLCHSRAARRGARLSLPQTSRRRAAARAAAAALDLIVVAGGHRRLRGAEGDPRAGRRRHPPPTRKFARRCARNAAGRRPGSCATPGARRTSRRRATGWCCRPLSRRRKPKIGAGRRSLPGNADAARQWVRGGARDATGSRRLSEPRLQLREPWTYARGHGP